MRQSRVPMAALTIVTAVLAALACTALDAAAPPVSKPPWQRLLKGEDAIKAAGMEQELTRLQAAGRFEEALTVAQALRRNWGEEGPHGR